MVNKTDWSHLDKLLYQKCNLEQSDNGRIFPKICHHAPNKGYPLHYPVEGPEKYRRKFCLKAYEDQKAPGIYIGSMHSRVDILRDHPEIRFFASVGYELDEKDFEMIHDIRGDEPIIARGFEMTDWDRRVKDSFRSKKPTEDNVSKIIDYLKEWRDAGAPSFLIHCAAGQYRSVVTSLIAHSMITRAPIVSGTRVVMAGWGKIDSNWEIARVADQVIGFNGKLHSTAVNIQRAEKERNQLLSKGASLEEVLDAIMDIFLNPWDEEQAATYFNYNYYKN
ncbi:MAG: hypothetical protein OXH90_06235 [Paracoccaceae bacterium]|nr:hypothetical protein [Paracoccaceae bacterium]MDE2915724.1 hypothetical protein [Paracoccaceae bacterium]